jgi:pentatricopeptide repeat protein
MSRAKANLTLVGHGKKSSAEAAVADLEALLSELKGYTYKEPSKAQVYSTLVDVHVAAGRIDSAEAVFNRDTEVASDSTLRGTSYFLSLARGQLDSAREVADTMLAADSTDGSALFLASVSRLLAGDTNAVVPAIRFLDETEHEYRDYVRLMLSWSLRSRGESDRARAIINQRWNEVDSSTWPRRIEQGDVSAWREMLIGYYAGHVPRARIFGPLANESSYQSGALHALGYPLNAARCEAYFYDALLQSVSGLTWTRRKRELAALDAAIATRYYQYYEYHMAHILRERLTGTKRPSPSATLASSF